jgi:hypothetical protein
MTPRVQTGGRRAKSIFPYEFERLMIRTVTPEPAVLPVTLDQFDNGPISHSNDH